MRPISVFGAYCGDDVLCQRAFAYLDLAICLLCGLSLVTRIGKEDGTERREQYGTVAAGEPSEIANVGQGRW